MRPYTGKKTRWKFLLPYTCLTDLGGLINYMGEFDKQTLNFIMFSEKLLVFKVLLVVESPDGYVAMRPGPKQGHLLPRNHFQNAVPLRLKTDLWLTTLGRLLCELTKGTWFFAAPNMLLQDEQTRHRNSAVCQIPKGGQRRNLCIQAAFSWGRRWDWLGKWAYVWAWAIKFSLQSRRRPGAWREAQKVWVSPSKLNTPKRVIFENP